MTCRECIQHLDKFDGSKMQMLPKEVVKHLRTCESCSLAYLTIQAVDAYVASRVKEQPTPFLTAKVMNKVGQQQKSQSMQDRRIHKLLIAASVAATITLGIMVGNLFRVGSHISTTSNEMNIIDDSYMESISLLTSE